MLLDAYAIALEQQILAEAFFTLALVGIVLPRRRARPRAGRARGRGRAAARPPPRCAPPRCSRCPVWLALCAVGAQRAPRLIGPAALGPGAPAARATRAGTRRTRGAFGLTQADGWFLYGRVGEIADCGDADIPRRRATAVRPQRARPPRGRGVPHLERRRPGAAHVRRDEPRPRRAGALERCAARLRAGDHPRPPRRATRELVRDDFLRYFDARGACARQLRPRRRAAAVRPARAPQRDRARSLVPRLRPAREPSGQARARLPRARPHRRGR